MGDSAICRPLAGRCCLRTTPGFWSADTGTATDELPAAGMCVYAWGNNIFNNPGISYNKAHRSDQEARDDDPNSLTRSKRYTSGIFRRLGDVRACFFPGTGCMRSLLVPNLACNSAAKEFCLVPWVPAQSVRTPRSSCGSLKQHAVLMPHLSPKKYRHK